MLTFTLPAEGAIELGFSTSNNISSAGTEINLYENEETNMMERCGGSKAHWHIILALNNAYEYSAAGFGSPEQGLFVFPPFAGQDKFKCLSGFKGHTLSIPEPAAVGLGLSSDMDSQSYSSRVTFAHLNYYETKLLEGYFNLIIGTSSYTASHDSGRELKLLCQALVESCQKHYNETQHVAAATAMDDTANEFVKLVMSYCRVERKLDFYARKLNLTPKYLSALVSAKTGRTTGKWIEEYTIIAAKDLLNDLGHSVASVSKQLNFNSSSEFCKYFRKCTGISTTDYRKSVMSSRAD